MTEKVWFISGRSRGFGRLDVAVNNPGYGHFGDPAASAAAVLRIADAEDKPLRVFFGTAPLGIAGADYADRLETWEKWNDVSVLAQG